MTIVIGGKTLEIVGTKLMNLTSYPSSLTIRRQEKNLLDLYFSNGLRLKIDQNQQNIIVQIDQNLLAEQSVSGLCGDFNRNPEDDLKLWATGGLTKIPVEFGNQWKLDRSVRIHSLSINIPVNSSVLLFSVRMLHLWSMIVPLLQQFWMHALH